MHIEAVHFISFVKKCYPMYFNNVTVLDVGSGDINGNNQQHFTNSRYCGNDLVEAKNVTIVSKTKDLPFEDSFFDTVISTECFEHDAEYVESLKKIMKLLKPGGLFVFTCASTNRPEHGTRRTTPHDSYGTIGNIDNFPNYYKNLTVEDINNVINLKDSFSVYQSYYNPLSCDLYFVGFKKHEQMAIPPMFAYNNYIVNTTI